MKEYDVIVIGAGIIGAACALKLTNYGLKVLIVDRGSIVGGTTGAGEGNILISDKEPGAELTLAIRSRNAWFEISDDIGDGFELESKGGIVVSRSNAGMGALRKLAVAQRKAGVNAVEVDAESLHILEPYLAPEITAGIHYPEDAQCQPMLATAHMLRAVRKRGGVVIIGVSVLSIGKKGGRVKNIVTSMGEFRCDNLINATGAWAGEIAELAGSFLPIAPRKGFILVTTPAPAIIRHKVYDADYVASVASGVADLQSSAVVEATKSGTILIGASRERVGFNSELEIAVVRRLAVQAMSLFPVLKNLQLLRVYHGFRPYAPDHLPIIGEDPNVAGLWHAAGHEGAGIGLAPATAEIITAQITGGVPFIDPTPFSPSRFFDGKFHKSAEVS